MPVVTFANIKGGSGKTTAALTFAGEVHAAGGKIILFEGDPNRPLATWAAQRNERHQQNEQIPVIEGDRRITSAAAASAAIAEAAAIGGRMIVIHDPDEERTFHWIEAAAQWASFVIADPEGSPNDWLNAVASASDLVLIPFAPTALDAQQVSRTVQVLARIGRLGRQEIPYRLLLTKAAPGAVMTRDERDIRKSLAESGLPMIAASLRDRPAYRCLFKSNKTLRELSEEEVEPKSLREAITNAAQFATEVGDTLRTIVAAKRSKSQAA